MTGTPRDDCAATRKRARAPVKFSGIACDDVNIAHGHAKLGRDDLGEAGIVPLPLRTDPCCYTDLAICANCDTRALIGADPCALDVTHDANTDMLTLSAQLRLLILNEVMVIDNLQRALH